MPSLRVALGLGDQELEQRLRPTLDAADDLEVVAQCLSADQLLQVVQADQVEAVVVAWSLHRLSPALIDELERPGLTLVLLVPDPSDERWAARAGPVLGLDVDAPAIRQALLANLPGVRPAAAARARLEPLPLKPVAAAEPAAGGVIAVAGGVGSPGRTTVAINLAAALGTAGSSVLVEADLCAPAIAAYLDRDPSRNLCTLAHAVRDDARMWSAALEDELQALGPPPLSSLVMCGPPKREMRTSVQPQLLERLIAELARRYRWVIVDVGPELLGVESPAATHRAVLARAQHVLLVTAADLVGLWHARTALDQFERLLGIERRRVHLVINRHDGRFHHSRQEVEWHLGVPVAGVIPFDHVGTQRAVAEQQPVVLDPSSRAGRALLVLGEQLNDGKLRLPLPTGRRMERQAWWRRILGQSPPPPLRARLQPESVRVGVRLQQRSRAW